MKTCYWKLVENSDNALAHKEAAEFIKAGECVAFPTETVYGVCCIYDSKLAHDKLLELIVKGCFPQIHADPNTEIKDFYAAYLTSYLEKDVPDFINLKSTIQFVKFVRLLASNTGQEFTYNSYSKAIGVDTKTIVSWTNVLEETGIIYFINPYFEHSFVKRMVRKPKMYFFDTGLVCYLCSIDSSQTLDKSMLKGRLFETFCMNEIRKSYFNSNKIGDLYYYRDLSQNEIDLLIINQGCLTPIEFKANSEVRKYDKTKTNLLNKSNYAKGPYIIVYSGDVVYSLDKNSLIVPIRCI